MQYEYFDCFSGQNLRTGFKIFEGFHGVAIQGDEKYSKGSPEFPKSLDWKILQVSEDYYYYY